MAENQQNETQAELISTTVDSPATWQRVIKATVDRAAYDREYAIRLKRAAKGHQKPGFRKGHTPKALDTVEALVPRAWVSALVEHKLAPINDPALENLKFEAEGPLTFDLVVEVRPEITVGDFNGLPVKRRAVAIGEAEVDRVLERLQESRSEFAGVDRASAEGDQISLDLVPGVWEGQSDTRKVIPDQKFVLGSANNMPAFNVGLLGVTAGDEKKIDVVYPVDHSNPTLKGQTITFTCQIKEVAAKVLPALDDELAARIADGKTLDELKAEIRADLQKEAERRVAHELDAQIRAELIARHTVELPPSMVEGYLKSGLEELHRRNARAGRPSDPEEDQQYREAGRPHAEKALKGMLLIEAVRRQEEIKVTAEDVDDRIGEIAADNGFDVEKYREFVNGGGEKDRIEYDLQERKTFDFLLSRAKIEDVSADTEVLTDEEE
jgi:trigger factor